MARKKNKKPTTPGFISGDSDGSKDSDEYVGSSQSGYVLVVIWNVGWADVLAGVKLSVILLQGKKRKSVDCFNTPLY